MEIFLSVRIIALLGLFILFAYTVYLIRIGKLSAHLAVSWVMTEILLIVVLSIKQSSKLLTDIVGEKNFYSTALLLIIGWVITLMLDTLTRVSELTNKTRAVIQDNALLREKVERLEKEIISQSKNKPA